MSADLKPCPFCGGIADRAQTFDNDWWVCCVACKGNVGYFDTEAEAVANWQQRVHHENVNSEDCA